MGSIVIELFVGITLIGSLLGYKRQKDKKQQEQELPTVYGRFCICYTKGERPKEFTYIPWMTRLYKTEQDLDDEEGELARLALDKDKNSYFREQGVTGFAVVDVSTGDEIYWCRLAK
jgi:hypothetical protein